MGQLFAYAIKSGNLINVRLHPIILYSLLNSTYGERKYNILETDGHKLFEFFDTISKEDTKLILEHISLELKYSDRNINGISTIEEILEKIRSYDDDILQTAPYSDYLRKRILTDEEWRELTKQERSICLQDISCDSVQFSRKSNTEDLQRKLKQARDHMIKTRKVRSEIQKKVDQAKVQTDEMKKIMDDAITKSMQANAAFQTIQREINRNLSMQAEETGDEGYKIVAYEKREQFIEFKIKSYLFNQFRGEYEEFVRGFHSIIPLELLQGTNISPKSLDLMIAGKRKIDLNDFLANLQITGASEEKKELIMEIIREGVSEHNDYLNKLLFFITAKENLSYLGYGDFSRDPLRLNFTNIEASMPHTCFNYADIPQSYLEDDINTDESGNTWTLTSREKLAKELSYQQLLSEKDMTFNRAGGGNKIIKLFL
tara:strand:- start:1861 stop:3150 length:1290 start_codon:yes stop_codon:yes gene_type:complete